MKVLCLHSDVQWFKEGNVYPLKEIVFDGLVVIDSGGYNWCVVKNKNNFQLKADALVNFKEVVNDEK